MNKLTKQAEYKKRSTNRLFNTGYSSFLKSSLQIFELSNEPSLKQFINFSVDVS